MSDAIRFSLLETTPATIFVGEMDFRDQQQGKQDASGSSSKGGADSVTFSAQADQQVQKLQERDREVRAHEQAHIAAGGQYVSGGASFSYQTGPDGKQYAIGGSVQIDSSPVPGDPKATEEKARTVRRAALAPANPSATDQSVAANASAMESKARSEQAQQTEDASLIPGAAMRSSGTDLSSGSDGADQAKSSPGQERVAATYAAVRDSAHPPTSLAPSGTGISISV